METMESALAWNVCFSQDSVPIDLNPTQLPRKKSLVARTLRAIVFGPLRVAVVLFGMAGSFDFWQAWILIAINFVATTSASVYFYKHDPQLLERRLLTKEKLLTQKIIIVLWKCLIAATFVLAGYDHRIAWSRISFASVPLWLQLLSLMGVAIGYALYFQVMKTNSFAASVIQVEAGQPVISTGLYRTIRHPMYLAFAIIALFTPLALGSFLATPISLFILLTILLRLSHEERVLRRELAGYTEYCRRTPHRLIPFLF